MTFKKIKRAILNFCKKHVKISYSSEQLKQENSCEVFQEKEEQKKIDEWLLKNEI